MLKDLENLKGFDFSKKIIYTDDLSFDELFFINENWKESLIFDLPNPVELSTPFEDFEDNDYKILYFNYLYNKSWYKINADFKKEGILMLDLRINCFPDEYIHIMNNIIDVAISNNHIVPVSDLEDKEGSLRDYAHINNSADDLRDILNSYNLSSQGNKSVLIDRLFDKLSIEELETIFLLDKSSFDYEITDNGIKLVMEYELYKYREILPIGFTIDDFLNICSNNKQYSPEEILFCLCYQDWIQFGKNSDSLSEIYKTEVSNVNAEYKINVMILENYPKFILELYEKIISEGNCDDIDLYKENYKYLYDNF